jgi:hypothetical protein
MVPVEKFVGAKSRPSRQETNLHFVSVELFRLSIGTGYQEDVWSIYCDSRSETVGIKIDGGSKPVVSIARITE